MTWLFLQRSRMSRTSPWSSRTSTKTQVRQICVICFKKHQIVVEFEEVGMREGGWRRSANGVCCSAATPLEHGDIRRSRRRNAAPCAAAGCRWPKRSPYVYVPVTISSGYSRLQRPAEPSSWPQKIWWDTHLDINVSQCNICCFFVSAAREQQNIIINALVSFHQSTCIRFFWRQDYNYNYLNFFSGSG